MAFAQLERTFCEHLGPVALDRLTALVQRPVPARTIIALGGDQLTGKSTLAKALSHHFGAHTVSSGAVFRTLAKQRGVSLVELLKQAATEVKIDIQCDYGLCELVGGAPLTDIKTDGSVLVLEGRNPACMASYMRTKYGSNIRSVHIHLRCTPLEQSLRFVERECHPATLGQFARHNAQTLMARGAMPSWALGDIDASSVDEAGTRLRALLESLLAGQHEESWRKAVQPFVENVQRDVLDRQVYQSFFVSCSRFCFLHFDRSILCVELNIESFISAISDFCEFEHVNLI
jgi:cytidylate kinase